MLVTWAPSALRQIRVQLPSMPFLIPPNLVTCMGRRAVLFLGGRRSSPFKNIKYPSLSKACLRFQRAHLNHQRQLERIRRTSTHNSNSGVRPPPKLLAFGYPFQRPGLLHALAWLSAAEMHPRDNLSTSTDTISTSDHDDAIIRVASYHRRDFNLAVIHSNTSQLDSFGLSLFKSFSRNPVSTLGPLEALPLELLTTTCLLLDLQSAFCFSHVNSRAKEVIASIWEYRQIREHALQCLWAAFRTGMAPKFGVSALYTALVTKACSLCGAFGRFLFLPTATQCCLPCLESASEFALLSVAQACKATGRSRASLRRLMPILYTIPGTYGMSETNRKRRGYFVAKTHCSELLQKDGLEPLHTTTSPDPLLVRYMASSSIPYLDVATGCVQTGLSCKGCQAALEDDAIEIRSTVPFRLRDKVYSREGFLDHFRQCDGAKALWISSKGGTVPFKEPVFTKQGGYFTKR